MATEPSATAVLGMSDEDFSNLNGPAEISTEAATETVETTTETETATAETVAATETTTETAETTEAGGETTGSGEAEAATTGAEGEVDPSKAGETSTETEQKTGETADTTGSGAAETGTGAEKSQETQTEPPNYEDFYQKVLGTPLKANGKEIKLTSVDEVIALMQQGANYTRKMQELAPARKVLMMLQNNELLDADKLSFLIDLEKGNPEAIKKLVKDKGIDVMDIDTESEPAYQAGDNVVTDAEVGFRTVLDEISSSDAGKQTLTLINTTWDDASKKKLWDEPSVMQVVHQQRETGVYDLIATEVERRTTLGLIPAGTPFLQAYTIVGNEWAAEALKGQPGGGEQQSTGAGQGQQSQVLATRAATPKATVANDDKASAASPTRSSPKPAAAKVNVLSMSDEEFMKQADVLTGRV
jgi:hypothetical protein